MLGRGTVKMKLKIGLLLLLLGFSFNFSAVSTDVYADGAESDVGIFFSDIEEVPSKPDLPNLKPNPVPKQPITDGKTLPQTGEQAGFDGSIIGIGVIGMTIFLLNKNKKRSQNGES